MPLTVLLQGLPEEPRRTRTHVRERNIAAPHPCPTIQDSTPLGVGGGPTLGLSKVSPSRECPGHFRPPTPPSFPWPLGALQFHLPWVSPSAPPRPRHPPRGHVLPADPFTGQYNSRFSADRRRHPLFHPCSWKQISPGSCRETAWPASFSHTSLPAARLGPRGVCVGGVRGTQGDCGT